MNYFSRITADHWTAKNRLEAAAKEVANHMDRQLIAESELETFKDKFKTAIEKINADHPRCNELELTIHKSYLCNEKFKDVFIYVSGVFQMSLFEVKE